MSTTLVIGGTGFLGAHVVAAAHADPKRRPVIGSGRDPRLAPRFCQPRDAARWVAADLAALDSATRLCDELEPAALLSCAALSRQADCEADPRRAERLNVALAAELARWCASRGARLLHVSTDLVFGEHVAPEGGFDEEAPTAPVSAYGHSKAEGEAAVLAAHPAALVVRMPLLYGNSGGRGLGASDWLFEAVERDERPALFTDEFRTPLEVASAARALVELVDSGERGILHVAGPERASRHELGLALLAAMGLSDADARAAVRPALQAEVATPYERPADVSLNASRARERLTTRLPGIAEGARDALG